MIIVALVRGAGSSREVLSDKIHTGARTRVIVYHAISTCDANLLTRAGRTSGDRLRLGRIPAALIDRGPGRAGQLGLIEDRHLSFVGNGRGRSAQR